MAPRLKPVHMGNVCTSSQSGRTDKCVVAALEFGFVWRAIRQSRSSADGDHFLVRLERRMAGGQVTAGSLARSMSSMPWVLA
jgi:hypothetical protein